jgi:hypothetical protein
MKLDGKPDAVGIRIIAVPRITRRTIGSDVGKWVVGIPGRQGNLLVHRRIVSFLKFLDAPYSVNLRVDFDERMLVVNVAIRPGGRPPQIQPDPVWADIGLLNALIGEYERVELHIADFIVRGDVQGRRPRKLGEPIAEPIPFAEYDTAQVRLIEHPDDRYALRRLDAPVAEHSRQSAWVRHRD